MIDQIQLYDQALLTWLTDTLPPLLEGRTTQLLYAISRKAFAEVTSGQLVDNETLTLPRISIQRQDPEIDANRFNSNRIRRLGWCNDNIQRRMRNARFPAPVNINYQVDLWTRFMSEMNRWEQELLFNFAPQYIHLQIRPDDVWGDKLYAVFLEGSIINNSDLEPGEGERQVRKTMNLRAECWIFDQDTLGPTGIVKRMEFNYYDKDTATLFETQYLPPLEVIAQGAPPQVVFGPIILQRPPVLGHTPVIQTIIGGTTEIAHDDGSGNLTGDKTAGTINYTTGEINLTFTDPPDAGEDISITYFTDLS